MKRIILAVSFLVMASPLMAAWTADVVGVSFSERVPGERQIKVLLKFTDGITTVNDVVFESVDVSTTILSNFCKLKISQYQAIDASKTKIPLGPVDLTTSPLSVEDIARNKFFADFNHLEILKRLVAAGVVNAQADMDAMQTTVNDEYRREYLVFSTKP